MRDLIESAKQLPLAFAQVREDALLDLQVVESLGKDLSVLMIASGGCTAALLSTSPNVTRIDVTDVNPAQIALCKLKMRLLKECPVEKRLAILGYAKMDIRERKQELCSHLMALGLPDDIFGPIDQVSKKGPDHMGRYEHLFELLRQAMGEELKSLSLVIHKNQALDEKVIDALRKAFDSVMALPNLVALFGDEATQNAVKPFADHFFDQTINILRHQHLATTVNPYLHQMLSGHFGSDVYYPWLSQTSPSKSLEINYLRGSMLEALHSSSDQYDLIHLSNILDWLSEDQAMMLLENAAGKLKKGGRLFIRQLNSKLDIPQLCGMLTWDHEYAEKLLSQDRSFFYPKLHIGIKL